MREAEVSASELARACRVTPAAVFKWREGHTKELKADNYIDAARALGVSAEWLRTGKLPREREHAQEENQMDQVLDLLEDLKGPLASLAAAIEQIGRTRPESTRRKKSG